MVHLISLRGVGKGVALVVIEANLILYFVIIKYLRFVFKGAAIQNCQNLYVSSCTIK